MSPADALSRIPVEALPGWEAFDIVSVWPAWQRSAQATVTGKASLRPARPIDTATDKLLRRIAAMPHDAPADDIRHLLATGCDAAPVPDHGFLTGYYEPIVEGSLTRSQAFAAPVLPRPADLVTLTPSEPGPGLPGGFTAARRLPDGRLEPYPARAAIEEDAVGPAARPILWLRDWTELFLIQVQGSARVRLPDRSMRRLVYAGRNGHPYTSIGRLLVEAGEIRMAEMSLARLKAWLRDHGQDVGQPGRTLMQRNRSYIFFDLQPDSDDPGPTGGAGVPLTPGVSIAVDRGLWPYGLPFWIETDAALPGFGPAPFARLFIAQDTGSAIVGPGRIDLFLGSGEAAGAAAGSIRHPARVAVLLPKT